MKDKSSLKQITISNVFIFTLLRLFVLVM